jgi:iron complex outermembrane receptor protein
MKFSLPTTVANLRIVAKPIPHICVFAGLMTPGFLVAQNIPASPTNTYTNTYTNAVSVGSENTTLESVQVNGGKLAIKQFDTPASTFFVDQNTVSNSGIQVNLSDALNLAPGVVSLNRNNYAQDIQISIRGFGARTAFGLRGIRLITDDIPATIPDGQGQASTVSLTSVDHIEVLSGPLAQLYGNSSGGVIQTFTKEAGPVATAQVQSYFGSYGMQRFDWQLSERFGAAENKSSQASTSKLGIVADYSTFKTDGWRQNSSAQRNQVNSVITYDPQEDTRFKVVLNSFNMPLAQDPLGLNLTQLRANPQQAGTNALLDLTQKTVKQDQIGLVLQQKVSSSTQFQARIYDGIRDTNQTQASSCDPSNLIYPTCTSTPPQTGSWIALQRNFNGVGLQLKGRDLTSTLPWEWLLGFDYDRSTESRQTGKTTTGTLTSTGAYLQNVATNSDLFLQTNLFLNESWTLTAGIRQDHVTITNTNFSTPNYGGASTFTNTNPVIGVTLHALDNVNVYANAGLGFETPTTSETAYSLPSPITGLPKSVFNTGLKASESHDFEVGTKWLESKTTQLNAAWFLINTSNDIISAYSSGGQTVYQNAAQTTREGFEFSLRDSSTGHFRQQASLTLMRAQYDTNYFNALNQYQAVAGNMLPAIPKESLYASIAWSQKGFVSMGKAPLSGAEIEVDLSARSNMWANDSNSTSSSTNGYAPGYGVFDIKLHERFLIDRSTLDAYLSINNATNLNYVGSVIVNQANAGYFEPGLPRNFMLGLKFSMPL